MSCEQGMKTLDCELSAFVITPVLDNDLEEIHDLIGHSRLRIYFNIRTYDEN